jgi:cobaltochelatase CobN
VNYSEGRGGVWYWYNAEADIKVNSSDITGLQIELDKESGIDEKQVLAYLDKSSISGKTYSAGMTGNNYKSSTIVLLKQKQVTIDNSPHLNVSIVTGYSSYEDELVNFTQRINSNPDLNITVSTFITTNLPDDINLSNMDIIYIKMVTQSASEFENTIQSAVNNGALVIGQNTYLPESNYTLPADYNTTDKFKDHLDDYWSGASLDDTNFDNLIFYLAQEYYGREDLTVEKPTVIPRAIYHPGMKDRPAEYLMIDADEYFDWYANRTDGHAFDENASTIGITFYSSYYPDDMDAIDKLIEGFEENGVNVIACYGDTSNYLDPYLNHTDKTKVDTVVSFHYRGNYFNIEELGVPVMNAVLNGYMNTSEWLSTSTPLPVTNMLRIYGPETEGAIDPIIIGAKETVVFDDSTVEKYIGHDKQIEWLLERAIAQANLGVEDEANKKVAIIYYNHGGGKDNIGASYLEVTPSIVNLLKGMADDGYNVHTNLIPNKTELVDLMVYQGRNIGTWAPGELEALVETDEVELIPESTYLSWFNELPEERKTEVIETWGEAPGEIMVYTDDNGDNFIVIPKISISDNIILAPQPTRGWLQDNEVLYHDEELPPHHQYIAFYLWLQHEFDADVMVNMGRHGTVEWLPGNDFCVLSDQWPALMVGDIPVIYPYVMDGMGEGMQAKRKGNAVVIDHLIPPVVSAGLYGNYSQLSSQITSYQTSVTEDENLKQAHLQEIVNLTTELDLDDQVNMSLAQDNETIDDFLDELTDILDELKSQSMPYGLHVLGEAPEGEALVGMVNSMLGNDFSELVAAYNESDNASEDLLSLVLLENTSTTEAQAQIIGTTDADIDTQLNTSIAYALLLSEADNEINQVLNAMNGEYIRPNLGGDPVLRPDTLPSGSNFYAFDEQLIPTKQAWLDGKALVDQWLAEYYAQNGEYPTKVGYILWAGESTRHEGIMESQILYMMGIKPVWNEDNGEVEDVRYINSTELGRPRIDVIVQISGLYRDTFPMKVKLIDKAVRIAYEQDETDVYDNYVTRNTDSLQLVLNETIQDKNLSLDIAQFRIFGPADGAYGTGMANAVDASDTWENNTELAELYVDRMSYAYGQNIWGQTIGEYIEQKTGQSVDIDDSLLFENYLKDTEAIFHSRSSSTYGSLDTDDFYQYMGGLYNAIKYISGTAPEAYVVNLQDRGEIQTLQTYITNELYARYLNPLWISGMREHGFEGAREMESFLENLWGWEALNPDLISDDVWNNVYENYFANAELSDWIKANNPYAYQSMVARMTETIRKDSWDASDETLRSLVSDQVKSVVKNGATCCHHTCGNILNQEFVDGIAQALVETGEITQSELDLYREIMKEATTATEKAVGNTASKSSSSSTGKDLNVVETSSGNQTTMNDAGAGAELDKEAATKSPSQDNYVEGYEMTKENVDQNPSSSNPSISGSDVIASLFVVAGVGAMYFGFWRRRKF